MKQNKLKEIDKEKHITKPSNIKDNERILKAVRQKQLIIFKSISIKLPASFLSDIMESGKY